MNKKLITSGCGILCVFLGSAWYYFQGHKENGFLNGLGFIVIVIGWICALLPVGQWLIARVASVVGYILFGGIIFTNVVLVINLSENRVQEILANDPVSLTTGTITAIESRSRRSVTKIYAMVQFSAGSELIEQEIIDERGEYVVGQQFEVKYSIEHPDVLRLERLLENSIKATDLEGS
jgi:hypothetical protein